jgi:hypothetical protein
MFPQPEHTSFFTDFYSDAHFPECLLRPPAGWLPSSPAPLPPALEGEAMRHAQPVYRALYSETGANYKELYDALRRALPPLDGIRLLGSHGAEPAELEGLVFDTVRSIVEHWPQPPRQFSAIGRSLKQGNDDALRSRIRASGSPGQVVRRDRRRSGRRGGAAGETRPVRDRSGGPPGESPAGPPGQFP